MFPTALPSRDDRRLAPILAAGAAAMFSAAAIALLLLLWRPAAPPGPRAVAMTIGSRALELDVRLLHSGPQRAGGRLDRADLILDWPTLGPAQLVARDDRGRATAPSPASHVLVSLQAAEGVDPAARALTIHGRFIEPEIWSNPGGLIVRRFKSGSPYDGEELIMTLDGREFAARCPLPEIARNSLVRRCLSIIRIADIDATVSFDPALLPEWRRLKDGVVGVVGRALR